VKDSTWFSEVKEICGNIYKEDGYVLRYFLLGSRGRIN
jgi:hypothetical protein